MESFAAACGVTGRNGLLKRCFACIGTCFRRHAISSLLSALIFGYSRLNQFWRPLLIRAGLNGRQAGYERPLSRGDLPEQRDRFGRAATGCGAPKRKIGSCRPLLRGTAQGVSIFYLTAFPPKLQIYTNLFPVCRGSRSAVRSRSRPVSRGAPHPPLSSLWRGRV